MSTEQLRIEELTRLGLELHARAEQWRKALQEIDRFNSNPIISDIIKQNLYS